MAHALQSNFVTPRLSLGLNLHHSLATCATYSAEHALSLRSQQWGATYSNCLLHTPTPCWHSPSAQPSPGPGAGHQPCQATRQLSAAASSAPHSRGTGATSLRHSQTCDLTTQGSKRSHSTTPVFPTQAPQARHQGPTDRRDPCPSEQHRTSPKGIHIPLRPSNSSAPHATLTISNPL